MRPVPWSVLVVCTVLCSTVAAQMQRVIPAVAASEDLPARSFFPFTFDATRTQQLWDGNSIAPNQAVILAFAYRQDAKLQANPGRTIASMTVEMGHSSLTPATMSTTFAANRTGAMTTVFSGSYNLPTLPPASGLGALISFPLTTPFPYSTSAGNLLLELVVPGFATQRVEYMLDGVLTPSGTAVTPFGIAGRSSATLFTFSATLSTAGSLVLSAIAINPLAPPPTMSFLLFGTTASIGRGFLLPLDMTPLGAPANTLYTDPLATVPLPLVPSIGGLINQGTLSVPMPPVLPGTTFYVQSALVDPPANALGLVMSQGMAVEVGGVPPVTQLVVNSSSASPVGLFATSAATPGGPVVQLSGVFQ